MLAAERSERLVETLCSLCCCFARYLWQRSLFAREIASVTRPWSTAGIVGLNVVQEKKNCLTHVPNLSNVFFLSLSSFANAVWQIFFPFFANDDANYGLLLQRRIRQQFVTMTLYRPHKWKIQRLKHARAEDSIRSCKYQSRMYIYKLGCKGVTSGKEDTQTKGRNER